MVYLRSAIAVGLAFVFPGLGHAYLRQWVRSLLWAALTLSASFLLMPEPVTGGTMVENATAMVEQLSTAEQFVFLSLTLFNMIDAYVISVQQARFDPDAFHCPHCGSEVDEDLEFCHWCTTRLDVPGEDDRAERAEP